MKEFIEKLIGRLEEEKEGAKRRNAFDSEVSYSCAIRITNQLAEEYAKDTNVQTIDVTELVNAENDGWIPCSERLPEVNGNVSDVVLVCAIDGFQHMAFWCDDKKWRYCESGMIKNPMDWTEIIAWQPLPAPYQPKGE